MSEMQTQLARTKRHTRLNFSDENRALHLQALYEWLPEPLQHIPAIDWSQLSSHVIGYLVNTVGNDSFAAAFALATGAGMDPLRDYSLLIHISRLSIFLRDIQLVCQVRGPADLTKATWEEYISYHPATSAIMSGMKAYKTTTETHLPDLMEDLTPIHRLQISFFVFPPFPRRFYEQHGKRTVFEEEGRRKRKEKSDLVAPLHALLVALVQFRNQAAERLLSAYQQAREQVALGNGECPFPFSYEEELVRVSREAHSVAEVRLLKEKVTLRFLLWDRRTWVMKHPNDCDLETTVYRARCGLEEFATPQFFLEFLDPAQDLLWFGDLIRYRALQNNPPQNLSLDDLKRRDEILATMGVSPRLACPRDGILTPGQDMVNVLSSAQTRSGALVFDPEALCRGGTLRVSTGHPRAYWRVSRLRTPSGERRPLQGTSLCGQEGKARNRRGTSVTFAVSFNKRQNDRGRTAAVSSE